MENWLKSVSAFANGTGGVLVFGASEDGTVAGAKDMETASEIIRLKIEECIVPFPEIHLKEKESNNGKRLLLLEVEAGREMPYYYAGNDTIKAYVRSGKASIEADAQELKRLVLKGRHLTYDTQITGYYFKDFSFVDFCVAYEEWSGRRMNNRRFEAFGLSKGGKLTNAGLLFADRSSVSNSELFCRRWKGTAKKNTGELSDHAKYKGSLIFLINKSIWFVKRNMKNLWREENERKTELPDYCEWSLFEAVVNAFAHRDYLIAESEIQIDMFDDCLMISSPGGMPDGEAIQDKKSNIVLSVRRNPTLADIFWRIGYMKQQGTGLDRIRRIYEKAVNYTPDKAPEFYSDKGQFTVVLKSLNYGEDVQDEKDILYRGVEAVNDADDNKDSGSNRNGGKTSGADIDGSKMNGGDANGDKADGGDINRSKVKGGGMEDSKAGGGGINRNKINSKDIDRRKRNGGNINDGENKIAALNENEKKVLAILKEQPAISTDRISQQSKIAKRTVERTLQSLKKKGAVAREGSRRSGSWRVLVDII